MNVRSTVSLFAALTIAAALASPVVAFAEAMPTPSPPAQVTTPVNPLPPPGSATSADVGDSSVEKYIVIGVVLSVMTMGVAALVVLWFVVD